MTAAALCGGLLFFTLTGEGALGPQPAIPIGAETSMLPQAVVAGTMLPVLSAPVGVDGTVEAPAGRGQFGVLIAFGVIGMVLLRRRVRSL